MIRSLRTVTAAVLAGALAAACSAGTASSASHRTTPAQAARCTAQARTRVAAASAPVPLKTPSSHIAMKDNAGTPVWLIAVTQNDFGQAVAEGFQAAAKAAGMTARYVQAHGQVNQMGQLVQEAVSARAGGIVLFNVDPHAVSGPLQAARAAGITVIDFNDGNPGDPLEPGVYAHVAFDFSGDGTTMADWMLADSGCNLNVATLDLPNYPIDAELQRATKAEITKRCPACGITSSNFDIATAATGLAPLVQTAIRRNPSTTYVDPGFDAFAGIINPVIQQGGSKVKLVGHDGNSPNLQAMAAHRTPQAMTIAGPPEPYIGWVLVDVLARGMLGLPTQNWTLPSRLVDSSNLGDGTEAALFPAYQNFPAAFLTAWGVKQP